MVSLRWLVQAQIGDLEVGGGLRRGMMACEVWCHEISTIIHLQKRELHKLDSLNMIFQYPTGKSTISGIDWFHVLWSEANSLKCFCGLILEHPIEASTKVTSLRWGTQFSGGYQQGAAEFERFYNFPSHHQRGMWIRRDCRELEGPWEPKLLAIFGCGSPKNWEISKNVNFDGQYKPILSYTFLYL